MKIIDLGPYYKAQETAITALAARPSLWQSEAQDVAKLMRHNFTDTDTMMQAMHRAQDLEKIVAAGLENDAAFRAALAPVRRQQWKDFTAPPATADLQDSLAQKLYNADPARKDVAMINLGDGARLIGKWLVEKSIADGIEFIVDFSEPDFSALVLNHASDAGVQAMADAFLKTTGPVTKRIVARPGQPMDSQVEASEAKAKIYAKGTQAYGERVRSGDIFFTLTVIPTAKDAQIDGIAYNDYVKLFFEMCDQPWTEIGKAQEHLIAELDAAKTLRFTNNDGTDISMDIGGFTFCNSLIAKNVPGSEVFSAPRRDSVNGTIVAKGRFSPPHDRGEIIENLTLTFNNGKLVSYTADSGLQAFENELNLDEGARWIGEVGIGTNPHLKTHVANGLLVEKIGGSFHLALGACYTMKEYGGKPVNVDNGNKSALHWDVTTMLHGKGGRIYVDGRMIMDNGKFLDPKYDVLNRGWAAIDENKRPEYWRDYYRNKGIAPQ
jgi:aminopeptidase